MPRSRRLRAVAAHFELLGSAASGGDGPVGGELPLRPSRQGPLAGFRVLDMSAVISGPWGASILADQGADVIKIEGPAGPDLTRGLGSSPAEGMAGMYTTANRGKRSVTIDLQRPRGVEVLKLMAKHSDVVIQNFRPGVSTRLGVDYAALSAVNPNIVMLSITGFGSSGPYQRAKVYDPVIQAMVGVGDAQKGTVFDAEGGASLVHNLVMDKVTALNACQAVTAALLARERGSGGQLIELNMLDAAAHFLYPDAYYNQVWETAATPFPEWNRISQNYDFTVKDGKIAVSLGPTTSSKVRAEFSARVATMTRQAAFDWCLLEGIPCGKYNTREEFLVDPQVPPAPPSNIAQ